MSKQEKKFFEVCRKLLQEKAERKAVDLIDDDPDEYFLYYDSDSVDVGCGMLTVRREAIYDEDRAYKDAVEQVKEELVKNENDEAYELFENEEFKQALTDLLKGWKL